MATVTLSLSKKKISLQEPITLKFSSSASIESAPDFSLLNKNFEVLSSSQNQSIAISNGQMTQVNEWVLTVAAKQEGLIEVPSIPFGADNSPAEQIEVSAAAPAQSSDSLFIETEVLPLEKAFNRSQILYTVKLYRAVNLGQATLSAPKLSDSDAIIEKIGSDREYEYQDPNGNSYIVFERRYAIFTEHIGTLTIYPTIFTGQVVKGNSFFSMQTEYKRVLSNSHTLEIEPIAASFNSKNWLAAYDVKLSQEWSTDLTNLTAGEPVTWTITLQAKGCIASLIPDFTPSLPNSVKYYHDKASLSNEAGLNGIDGKREIKLVLIANEAGDLLLPEIKVKWWNLANQKEEIAYLPSQLGKVTMDPSSFITAMNEETLESVAKNPITSFKEIEIIPLWAKGLIALNGFWLVLIIAILSRGKKLNFYSKKPSDPSKNLLKKQLKQACFQNDPKKSELLLLQWGQIQFPKEKIYNLSQLSTLTTDPLNEQIDILYHHLYGLEKKWSGQRLWEAFKVYQKSYHSPIQVDKNLKKKLESLEQLYTK